MLFPAFEAATGMTGGGPTQVMRMEHQQMRGAPTQMAVAAKRALERSWSELRIRLDTFESE